jgi:hypothetical protein
VAALDEQRLTADDRGQDGGFERSGAKDGDDTFRRLA